MGIRYKTRAGAVEFLATLGVNTTEQGLADKASRGKGPRYSIINGRAVYTEPDLLEWVREQAARPVLRRRERPNAA